MWGLVVAVAAMISVDAQVGEQQLLTRQRVPANFHDPEVNVAQVEQLLANASVRLVAPGQRRTLSALIQDEFNISQTWTPAVYDQFLKRVLELNELTDPRQFTADSLTRLPDLPKTAQVLDISGRSDESKTKSSFAMTWDPERRAFMGSPTVPSSAPGAAASEWLIRRMPVSELGRRRVVTGLSYEELLDSDQLQVLEEPMTVTFEGTPSDVADSRLLNESERQVLHAFLSRTARTRPVLVVIDDAIPSTQDFVRTAEFVIRASREIREQFGLVGAGDSTSFRLLKESYKLGTSFCEGCEYPSLKLHSAMIREALREFVERDTAVPPAIEVIYLPINRKQLLSKEILTELMTVSLLADSIGSDLSLLSVPRPPGRPRRTPDFTGAPRTAEAILAATALGGALKPFDEAMTTATDRGILDGIVNFFWLYSMASRRPHFLSMSWTTPNLEYPVHFRNNGYGLWLAAAGNDPSINIHSVLRQFAARSSDPGDFLAIQNVAAACPGSGFATNADVRVFGFAFPGRVSPSLCGSSFSAPRVAWLLAAREAIKGSALEPNSEDWHQWRNIRLNQLLALQDRAQAGEARYRITPWQLLGEPATR
jgi:hypothetical protein